jgi:antitoxin VapB
MSRSRARADRVAAKALRDIAKVVHPVEAERLASSLLAMWADSWSRLWISNPEAFEGKQLECGARAAMGPRCRCCVRYMPCAARAGVARMRKNLHGNLPQAMALNIKDPETDALVRTLAAATGESITVAVRQAVRERLERIDGPNDRETRLRELKAIADHCAALPVLDDRTPDEIIGYDEHGLPV